MLNKIVEMFVEYIIAEFSYRCAGDLCTLQFLTKIYAAIKVYKMDTKF